MITTIKLLSRFVAAATMGAGFAIATATTTLAENYPEKPVNMLVGFNAGGFADAMARTLAEPLTEILGQPVVIKNMGGAGGAVAASSLANADADGYTLVNATTVTFALSPLLGSVSFTADDFDYLLTMARYESAFVSMQDKPWTDFESMVEHAISSGRPLLYATLGPADRIQMEFAAAEAGFTLIPIPATGGADAMLKVLGGHVDFSFSGGVHQQYVTSGDMVVLAAAGGERLNSSPDVKTMSELGFPAVSYDAVIAAPKGLPETVRESLNEALLTAANDPRFQTLVTARNVQIEPMGSEATSLSIENAAKDMSVMLETAGN